jgi:hypothetical protein
MGIIGLSLISRVWKAFSLWNSKIHQIIKEISLILWNHKISFDFIYIKYILQLTSKKYKIFIQAGI